MERRRRTVAAVIAAAALGVPVVALAGHSAEVVGVYEPARCAGSPCDPERDPAVDDGAVVDRLIQVHVGAEGNLFPLEWVRLEGRIDGDPRWICLQHWTTGTTQSYRDHYDWDTVEWPDPAVNSDCLENAPHYHGVATSNGLYHLRAVARDRQTGEHGNATSEAAQIRINNPPAPPVWVGDPRVLSDRTVELRFEPNDEPDMVEYVIDRTGPAEATYAIDAARPGNDARMPCSRLGDIAYRCTDRDVGEARAGEYRYTIVARRRAAAGSTRCSVASGNCIGSAPSEPRTVSIPRRGQTPTSPPERSPGEDATPDAIGSTQGETATPTSSPAAAGPSVSGPPGSSGDQNPVVLAVAAGLLTAVALQIVRFRGARV